MPESARVQKLQEFGLSPYAARAYLALLDLGTTEAREVSRLAKVPVAKVYSTLDHLHERGLVYVEPGPPKKYTPVPFREYLRRLRARHEHQIKEIEASADELDSLFPIRGGAEIDDRGGFSTLRGRESVAQKIASLAAAVERDVLIVATDHMASRPDLMTVIRDAASRGVKVRCLARPGEPAANVQAPCPGAEVRAKPEMGGSAAHVAIIVFDDLAVVVAHFVPDDASRYSAKDVGIVVEEGAMVKVARAFLEAAWAGAPQKLRMTA